MKIRIQISEHGKKHSTRTIITVDRNEVKIPPMIEGIYHNSILLDGDQLFKFKLNMFNYNFAVSDENGNELLGTWDCSIDSSPKEFYNILRESILQTQQPYYKK